MKNAGQIKDVYADDMISELNKISELIEDYNFISMVKFIIIFRIQNSLELFIIRT